MLQRHWAAPAHWLVCGGRFVVRQRLLFEVFSEIDRVFGEKVSQKIDH